MAEKRCGPIYRQVFRDGFIAWRGNGHGQAVAKIPTEDGRLEVVSQVNCDGTSLSRTREDSRDSGARMQPTAQAVDDQEKWPSPSGAIDSLQRILQLV